MQKNEPLLAEVRAPWEDTRPGWWRLTPRSIWRTLVYNRKYGWYWAPRSMDAWRYRRFLGDLDLVCLRTLKSHGALTARELADCLNKEDLLRTKPKRTGIHSVTAATVNSWLDFASRRGLVAIWLPPVSCSTSRPIHWELTEKGEEAMRPRFLLFVDRLIRLLPAVIASGLLLGVLEWLTVHPGVLAWAFVASLLILEIAAVNFFMSRSEKREAPGVAVVAIETLRSAKKTIPRL